MKKLLFAILFISTSAFASGELLISSQSIVPNVVPKEGIGIPILKLNLTAKNEDISIEKLVFQRTGLSDSQDVQLIRATGKSVYSRSFPMLTDDTATINFLGNFIIPAGTTETITVTANLNVQGMGRTIALNLVEIVSSASNNALDSPQTSGQENTTQASSFETKAVEIEKIAFTPSRLRLERWQKLGRFRLRNQESKSIELDTMYLKDDGVGALSDVFHDLILTSQNKIVSHAGTFSKKTARFSFLTETKIAAQSDRLLEVWGKIKRNKSTYSVDFNAENEDVLVK
jgi:hypothetical protein